MVRDGKHKAMKALQSPAKIEETIFALRLDHLNYFIRDFGYIFLKKIFWAKKNSRQKNFP